MAYDDFMRYILLAVCLVLAGCSNPYSVDYHPDLVKKPKNSLKYESDLQICKEEARPTAGETVGLVAFGGLADLAMAAGGNTRMLKSGETRVKECLENKGYKVQN